MSDTAPTGSVSPPPPGSRRWRTVLVTSAWLVLLAAIPWWLGLPPLLAIAAALLSAPERLALHASVLRRAMAWGLPGVLFSLQRGLGGDALAWAVALVGALVGFTLLAGLESWLDRAQPAETPPRPAPSPDWSELAHAPVGPPAAIIELEPVLWHVAGGDGPVAEGLHWHATGTRRGDYRLDDGGYVADAGTSYGFSPDGRWFAASLIRGRGTVLLDRRGGRLHRLRGWQLCGWHQELPWLQHGEHEPPQAWKDVLGDAVSSVYPRGRG